MCVQICLPILKHLSVLVITYLPLLKHLSVVMINLLGVIFPTRYRQLSTCQCRFTCKWHFLPMTDMVDEPMADKEIVFLPPLLESPFKKPSSHIGTPIGSAVRNNCICVLQKRMLKSQAMTYGPVIVTKYLPLPPQIQIPHLPELLQAPQELVCLPPIFLPATFVVWRPPPIGGSACPNTAHLVLLPYSKLQDPKKRKTFQDQNAVVCYVGTFIIPTFLHFQNIKLLSKSEMHKKNALVSVVIA